MRNLVAIIFLCFFSCQNKDLEKLRIIDVDTKNVSKVNLTAIAESVTPVVLETNDSCLLGKISRVLAANDYFFIVSSDLYQFTKEGKFVRKFSRHGHGPFEYLFIQAIATDEENELLYVATEQKILVFDFGGKLVMENSFSKFVDYMTFIDHEIWIISTKMGIPSASGGYRNIATLYKLNNKLGLVDSTLIKSIDVKGISGTIFPSANYISSYNGDKFVYYPVLLNEPIIRDTIYSIHDNEMQAAIRLHFKGASGEGDSKLLVKNIYWEGKYLFADYNFKKGQYCLCVNMTSQKQFNMKDGFEDDFKHTGIANLSPLNKEMMVFIKYGYELLGILDGITESDNPVLMLVKLKE